MNRQATTCTAFEGVRRIAAGSRQEVAVALKKLAGQGEQASILVFDDLTSQPVEFDLRGTVDDVRARLAGTEPEAEPSANADQEPVDAAPRGRGRPKLGVVAREITLLPRHWDWLNEQSGGASVALRKLVDAARLASEDKDRVRAAQESTYRFMTALAGNLRGYEEATRALYANDRTRFDKLLAAWPADVREHARRLADGAFAVR
ncbi:hypothetical protein BWP39_15385 [Paraburkholderia acidicola]|uniref:DUF2239 family protein n=1 Tax=Paraburkholderia acidicola TaxID=1912599 RepID=A0A2A4EZS3_9BURK|nr:DUF2239 family protein [Paraburkholderia acidicola]PCE25910.1 hypothetical protein BWP39_15385 [Paraburkholderia acidicola]